MTAHNVLETAKQRGIHLKAVEHEIRFDAPDGAIDDELIRQIKKHKAYLLLLLDKNAPIWCGTNCPKGERRQIDGMPVLWCVDADSAVIDMQECLNGYWIKDFDGRPYIVAG